MKRLFPLLLTACVPLSFSGSSHPTDHVFRLTPEDIAAANDGSCVQDWIGPAPGLNRAAALKRLDARGVTISERRVLNHVTAYATHLRVGKGFWKKPLEDQAAVLSHELVHYCQRDLLGDVVFVELYAHSAGRWRLEVPAYAQSIRTFQVQGLSEEELQSYIDKKLISVRSFYMLWDIEPGQYEAETRSAWEAVLEPAPSRLGDAGLEDG